MEAANSQPEQAELGPALSSMMAVKDDEELVCLSRSAFALRFYLTLVINLQKLIRTAANLTSTLLTHYIAVKLETILDKEGKISHEQFAAQIEARLGSGEGDNAKGPDMKTWSKGRGLTDVCGLLTFTFHLGLNEFGTI